MNVFEEKKGNIFKLLSEAISEGIIIVNENQEVVASNGAANAMFGYDENELLGEDLNLLIPKDYHKSHRKHFNNFIEDSDRRQMGHGRDLYGLRKDGTKFPVEAGLNPFQIYEHAYVMALVSDITIRKKQEFEIKELNANLENKIAERTKTLEDTVAQMKEEVEKRFLPANDAAMESAVFQISFLIVVVNNLGCSFLNSLKSSKHSSGSTSLSSSQSKTISIW